MDYIGFPKPYFGASLAQEGNKVVVRGIRSGSPAEDAGVSVNDEIIGCNGFRVSQGDFEAMMNSMSAGETASILIARDELLLELVVKMTNYERPSYRFVPLDDAKTKVLREYWLRGK